MRQTQQITHRLCTGAPLTIGGSFSSLSNEEMGPVHLYKRSNSLTSNLSQYGG